MLLSLTFIVLSTFLIAASVTNSEKKDLEGNRFELTDIDLKGDVGAFIEDGHGIEADALQSDDHFKRYGNETVVIFGRTRTAESFYRSKRRRKPQENEDESVSEYYKRRRRPDYEGVDEHCELPHFGDEAGSKADNKKVVRPGCDEDRRRVNRINIGGNCQTCGQMFGRRRCMSRYAKRVISGNVVQPVYKYPWIVALRNAWSGIYCGGAIISATYILTAGHCIVNFMKEQYPQCKRRGGLPKFCYFKPNEIMVSLLGQRQNDRWPVRIALLIPHDEFDFERVIHNIALIQLAAPIQCNRLSSPICLPPTDLHKFGGRLIVAGWGYNTVEGQGGPKLLREGLMKQFKGKYCQRMTNIFFNKPDDIICAVRTESNPSSCMGDSGSSIFAPFGNKFYTLGVTSRHSNQNCQTNMPVTYAKVFRYINWIRRHVKDLPDS